MLKLVGGVHGEEHLDAIITHRERIFWMTSTFDPQKYLTCIILFIHDKQNPIKAPKNEVHIPIKPLATPKHSTLIFIVYESNDNHSYRD